MILPLVRTKRKRSHEDGNDGLPSGGSKRLLLDIGAEHQHLSRLGNLENDVATVEFKAGPIDAVQVGNNSAACEVHRMGHGVVEADDAVFHNLREIGDGDCADSRRPPVDVTVA